GLETRATLPPRGVSYSIGRKTGGVMGKTGGVWVCVALATLCSECRGFQPTVMKKTNSPSRSDGSFREALNRRRATG
ncbi:MAG: hypothetical protein LBM92_05805, partial [Opitutaceae bacterium]|nr:hypothetical protein [Opitutaceae bacterium]